MIETRRIRVLLIYGIPDSMLAMPDSLKVIADKVRGVAAEKRYTQQRVAAVLDISRTSVVERYNGRVPFTAPEVFALAVAMDVPVARFFPEDVAK